MSTSSVFEYLYQEELYLVPSRTIILLNKEWNETSDEERMLLNKILASVKLSTSTVQILKKDDLTVNDLLPLNPLRVISFGVNISPIQKTFEFVPLDGIPIIVSEPLSQLDDAKKKSLWLALRQMFGI